MIWLIVEPPGRTATSPLSVGIVVTLQQTLV
jgi:hypothetical protein